MDCFAFRSVTPEVLVNEVVEGVARNVPLEVRIQAAVFGPLAARHDVRLAQLGGPLRTRAATRRRSRSGRARRRACVERLRSFWAGGFFFPSRSSTGQSVSVAGRYSKRMTSSLPCPPSSSAMKSWLDSPGAARMNTRSLPSAALTLPCSPSAASTRRKCTRMGFLSSSGLRRKA